METIQSSLTTSTGQSADHSGPPAPPPSAAGDVHDILADRLANLNVAGSRHVLQNISEEEGLGSTTSHSNGEGKAHLRGPTRSDVPLHYQLFKHPSWPRKKLRPRLSRTYVGSPHSHEHSHHDDHLSELVSPPNEHVHEQDTWVQFAMEDIDRGLKRLIVAARDLRKMDDSKSAEEYYSETLADVVKKQEMAFDERKLQ